MCGSWQLGFFPNAWEDPFSHRWGCQETSYFSFRKYRLLAIIFSINYFPSPKANPTVKQESLIQRYLLFEVGEESKEVQQVVVKRLI